MSFTLAVSLVVSNLGTNEEWEQESQMILCVTDEYKKQARLIVKYHQDGSATARFDPIVGTLAGVLDEFHAMGIVLKGIADAMTGDMTFYHEVFGDGGLESLTLTI